MANDDLTEDELTRKHISIRGDQESAVRERNLNLSGFVRDQLDDWMNND